MKQQSRKTNKKTQNCKKTSIQRVQALADISHSPLYAFALYKAISLHMCMLL